MYSKSNRPPSRPPRPKHAQSREYPVAKSHNAPPRAQHAAAEDRAPVNDVKQLVNKFCEETGVMDQALATDILAGTNWKLSDALSLYKDTFQVEELDSKLSTPPGATSPGATVSPGATSPSPQSNPWHRHSNDSPSSTATKPQPRVSNSATERDRYRLVRGLSKVYEQRDGAESMKMDKDNLLNENSLPRNTPKSFTNTNISLDNSFMIPDLSDQSEELTEYIEHELIDFVTMNILEQTGHINWWAQHSLSTRLWPLHTSGDGNCLLHAASLAMWGVQDKFLQLREKLDNWLKNEKTTGALYRRWRWQQTQSNMEMGLILTEDEWDKEWEDLVRLSSVSKKIIELEDGQETITENYYEFLEEFHVYVLAQILKRPIIVFADSVLRDVDGYPLSPIPFGGIYLPLECNHGECYQTPLLLAYDRSHFTAVVTMAPSKSKKEMNPMRDLVPLTGPECDLLPMHFFVDPGADVNWDSLPEDGSTMMSVITAVRDFLEVKNIPLDQIQNGSISINIPEKHKTTKGKIKDMFKANSKTSTHKSLNLKNSTAPADLELEPGNDLIMCAKLTINTPKAYQKDIASYIEITKKEYERQRAQGSLRDLKNLPEIAKKDYGHSLSVNTSQTSRSKSPTTISPCNNDSLCRHCEQYLGTAEHHNLCSSCYRQSESGTHSQPSQPCRKCGEFSGTAENHFYCSSCHENFLEMGSSSGAGQQANNSNISAATATAAATAGKPDMTQYAIEIPEGDSEHHHVPTWSASSNFTPHLSHGYYAFPHTYYIPGNSSITPAYDYDPPSGYLQRSPPHVSTGSSNGSLSLGMDMPESSRQPIGLHVVNDSMGHTRGDFGNSDPRDDPRGRVGGHPRDDPRGHVGGHLRDDPRGHTGSHPRGDPRSNAGVYPRGGSSRYGGGAGSYNTNEYSQSRYDCPPQRHNSRQYAGENSGYQGRQRTNSQRQGGGGGQTCCRICKKLSPPDENGLCRFCRKKPFQQQLQPVTMNKVRSHYLAKCKRKGCSNQAYSNQGLCQQCILAEQRNIDPKQSNRKYQY